MILTGQLDSPFVRRVAIALHIYDVQFEHNVISAYGDFDELLSLIPLGKVPALQLDDGNVLADSTLILDYLDPGWLEQTNPSGPHRLRPVRGFSPMWGLGLAWLKRR